MVVLKGSIQNGQVKLAKPTDLPDGTEVTVLANGVMGTLGIPDDQWPSTPEEISRLVARMDRIEPFEMTPAEEAEIEAWRDQVKQYGIAKQQSTLQGLFE